MNDFQIGARIWHDNHGHGRVMLKCVVPDAKVDTE